jgi:large subunit ribosomal protein L1
MAKDAKKPLETEEIAAPAVAEAITEAEAVETETTAPQEEKVTAKAGKRSAKAVKEAEEKEAKEERKAQATEADDQPKQQAKPSRSRLERRGKNFQKAAEQVKKDKVYTIAEALDLAVKTSPVKFDATVELHINLNVDPRHADQNLRDNLVLPSGTGKKIRVAAFADENVAGADLSGVEEITKQLDKGVMDFDILIATPQNMPKLGKYARSLGPRGLMPNPKSGTVTTDVAKAITEAKAGRVEYRVDSTGIVHLGVGKVSFGKDKLAKNVEAIFASIKANKPSSVKGTYVKTIHVTTTMGPSIAVAINEL